jgi:hypothetical protein
MTIARIAIVSLLIALLGIVSSARADVPSYVPFQGFLTDELGAPIDGLTDITFSLYDQEVGGTALFSETRTIDVEQGFLNLFIGSVNTLDPDLFDRPAVYLGVKINTDNEMIDRTRLASVPYAFFANQCVNAETLAGMSASAFAPASPDWSSIANRPSGLDNGDDNTTYTASSGLSLASNAFSIDSAYTQRRVSASCPAGSAIRVIASDGTVSCETDDDTDTDTDTTYAAGTGLNLDSTTFSLDTSYAQRRVTGTCPAGSSIRVIASDGTVSCEADNDDNTLYAAAVGGGLSLSVGNAFSIASEGVTSSMIAINTITAGNIATNAVDSAEIASGAVGASEIATGAVGLDELVELPSGAELLSEGALQQGKVYDTLAASFTPSAAARCLVTATVSVEHDGSATLPVTFTLLASNDGGDLLGVFTASALPVAGQVLTTTATQSATWSVTASATAFGCRTSIPDEAAYDGGVLTCQVSWVCF